MNPPVLSVIIPAYESEKTLAKCLTALAAQTGNVPHETIVVDSSPQNEAGAICREFAGVDFVRLPSRAMPGDARNVGAGKATGQVLVFVDADVFLEPDALVKIQNVYGQGYKIFGGALKLASGSLVPSGILEHFFFNHESSPLHPFKTRNNLSSAFLIIERETFRRVGGFKDIPRMEDTELTERLKKQGEKLYFIPSIVGHQLQTAGLVQLIRKIFINGNNLFFIRYAAGVSPFRKFLFFLAVPLLMLAKITRINVRNFRFQEGGRRWAAAFLSPGMYLLGLFWMAGFYKALSSGGGISRDY